jgi:integrase
VGRPDAALFRALSRVGTPTSRRLDAESVGYILQQTLPHAQAAREWNFKKEGRESDFGSHSLRAGFVTTAYARGMPEWQIQKVTRHKSTAVLRGYNRSQGMDKTAAIDEVLREW